jgi:hypothetical protein
MTESHKAAQAERAFDRRLSLVSANQTGAMLADLTLGNNQVIFGASGFQVMFD